MKPGLLVDPAKKPVSRACDAFILFVAVDATQPRMVFVDILKSQKEHCYLAFTFLWAKQVGRKEVRVAKLKKRNLGWATCSYSLNHCRHL